ncbi:isochorismatase family protein [Nocardioides marmoribigeumensis]|uniref:Nicotinamidase-related amidase/catechol 2,3-dioxygenase-like lactoylglutathione lyase family enzyme n=1 Tax=Nocardioides marmoribigeumensis TaxID=433649 RepID=A0ABU2BUX7_9ACTN|nr:isochorismatase family protein [Nocardioides marmoribigeumensis]MDR7362425.1 nicotinamidase-related amidase/catechol 2,3-dioxygenase-like lactoylglutathione lyase family enzyme [Nocardioides marmoribigeumensis]
MSLDLLRAERAALLVIDPQNAFCHPEGTLGISGVDVAPAQAAIGRIRELASAFQEAGLPVVWTQQVHLARDVSRSRKVLPSHTQKRNRVSALSGTWDADFVDEVKDLVTDPTYVVVKHRFGGFYETRLQALLDMLGVNALFIVGVTANACVETTLREAYLRDYDVVAVRDGIAAVRPEWTETAEGVWAHYLGVVSDTEEVLGWLSRATRPQALGVHHLLLETQDLDTSVDFFVDVLGFDVRKREDFRDGRRLVVTHQGLGLTEGGSGATGVLQHLCFSARHIDAIAERAKAAGHTIVRGPGPGPYGHTVYVLDPDGNEIELFDAETN